ncbi:hypothetical protein [Burkholderia sp. ABCPW 111]|uniref:hypothetical protein n=1 Tax=Burkholderia sp. ABCPW 111 TaxID=1820025 RepID=UPI00053140EF|nr:hypothetical protein [Burkholderia sp. ABCPW 111]KGR93961.1 hypothetical protein X946_5532 [Burkholderia sp. ABCPW 111]
MRIAICLASGDAGAAALFRKEQTSLIPKSLCDHERVKALAPVFSASVYDPSTAGRSLEDYLIQVGQTADVIVLLVDVATPDLGCHIKSACFVADVEFASHPKTNYKNYFAGKFARLLKNLASLLAVMQDGAREQIVLLPFRTFNAKELMELRRICTKETLSPDFEGRLEQCIESLRRRRRPRKGAGPKDQHYVDDNDKLFQYGLEHHARVATGSPHTSVCVLTGSFRFGRKIATDRHYNVTKENGDRTEIAGTFVGCHDDQYVVQPTSHLNIFSNDYRA